ncbi:MAG: Lrp/AsnC family transcriptional regulator [Desulfotignum sp.]|nr:Lrp/AsnC family transcriptional regulator [Desulfotignum sp.]MCF8113105.1 Lrp/AsnC family transcriptional regulator [Desulfotignum sp.]MCF8125600.1 Lrp/AsnC family transcriptional regulator [Desulfotignum sp.]
MDKTDLQIVQILQKKARIPNVEVSRTIGMAPSAVLERIKKLEASGIIQGYEVRLNPDMFNCAMVAFIHIQVADPACFTRIGRTLAAIDQVQEVHYLAGQDCLMAKLRVKDNKELETILRTRINNIEAVVSTRTHIVLSSFKESAKIMLDKTHL